MSVSTTTNYKLKKPSDDEFYDVSRYRDNMDVIDAQMKTNADAAAAAKNAAENVDTSGKADKATTISGYGITDAYTKTEVYSKTEVNEMIGGAGGVIVSASAPSKTNVLWIDTGNGGIAKYYDSTSKAWVTVKAVWG